MQFQRQLNMMKLQLWSLKALSELEHIERERSMLLQMRQGKDKMTVTSSSTHEPRNEQKILNGESR